MDIFGPEFPSHMKKRGQKPQASPFDRLIGEVRVTNILLAASLREHLGQGEIVRILSTQTTLSARDIGNVLGTSPATVAVTMGRWRKREALEGTKPAPSEQEQTDALHAAEMLWVVLANVSGGDWTQQSPEWQDAAARWRDNYFAALGGES